MSTSEKAFASHQREKRFLMMMTSLRKYDERQAKKPGYSHYAFAHYCGALGKVRDHVEAGRDFRTAILNEFCGPLCNRMLKACGFDKMTSDENLGAFERYPRGE